MGTVLLAVALLVLLFLYAADARVRQMPPLAFWGGVAFIALRIVLNLVGSRPAAAEARTTGEANGVEMEAAGSEGMPQRKNRVPHWAWIFAAACGAVPVATFGGALPGAVGFSGAAGCIAVARIASMPAMPRIGLCIAITVLSWIFGFVVPGLIRQAAR